MFYCFTKIFTTEADRNLTDWSGKKPLEYQQKQMKSVSSSTYSSEYLDQFNSKKFETFPIKLRRNAYGSFAKPRPVSGDTPSRTTPKSTKVRRNHTMLASNMSPEGNSSFGSQDSAGSGLGSSGKKVEVTNLEDIFHVNPKKRFEKKYRSMMKKKFDKTFGDK